MERRRAPRIALALSVEIWPSFSPKSLRPIFFTTKNISVMGFYFETGSRGGFEEGGEYNFSIIFPPDLTGNACEYVSGVGTFARVAEVGENLFGFGMQIKESASGYRIDGDG